jgi:hypothetical protein
MRRSVARGYASASQLHEIVLKGRTSPCDCSLSSLWLLDCNSPPHPPPPLRHVLSKGFGQLNIGAKSSATLTFTLQNPNTSVTLTGLQFFDVCQRGW